MNSKQPIRLEELDAGHPLRQHPFEAVGAGVPDGYFDSLASRVQARVAQTQPQPAGPLISWSWGRTVASLAGAGLVATLVWFTWPQQQTSIGRESLSGISNEAIVAYLDEQGINPDEVNSTSTGGKPVSTDSTTLQFLEVRPDAIRQELDAQDFTDELGNFDS